MSVFVTQEDILGVRADAAVLCVENGLRAAGGRACRRLAEAGGEALRAELRRQSFLPVGSCVPAAPCGLPFRRLLLCAAPHWLTGKANEMLVLRRCYESVYQRAEELGCRSVVMPFLSTQYYRFPLAEAVAAALGEAGRHEIAAVFAADTPELYALSGKEYRKPEIVSYVGYYRDHAIFALDNGLYARVDLRPEVRRVDVIPCFEACYRVGNNPLQPPMPEEEVARLRRVYEESRP